MTIEFFTGFEGCNNTADTWSLFDYLYWYSSYAPEYSSTLGFNGSKCIRNQGVYGNNAILGKNCTPAKTKCSGLHLSNSSNPGAYIFRFIGPDIYVYPESSGFVIKRGSTTIASNIGGKNVLFTSYSFFEAKLFSDASVGYIELYLNSSLVATVQGLNTGGQDITGVRWKGGSDWAAYDNIYIADEIQGEMYSVLLKPDSDSSVQFSPLSGTDNYAMLQSNDGDTSYVYSDTVGHKDLYTYEDLATGLVPKAISIVTVARKEGTGGRTLKLISEQNSVEYDESSDLILNTIYPSSVQTALYIIKNTSPDGNELTRDKLNALKFGFTITG